MLKKPRTTRQSATRALTWGPTERQYDDHRRNPAGSSASDQLHCHAQRHSCDTTLECEQRLCCCPWMETRREEKQRQTQKNLASHCGEGERQATMENVCYSKTGSKQPPAVEGACLGIVRLLARKDSTSTRYLSRSCNTQR